MPKKSGLEAIQNNDMVNFYNHKKICEVLIEYHNPQFDSHQIKVPFRLAVVSASGSGKTQWLLNLIARMSDTFGHIYICYRATEPLYEFLERSIGAEKITFITQLSKFPQISQMEKDKQIYASSMMSSITRIKSKES